MVSGYRSALAWRLLVLVLLTSVVNANLREFRETDDEDLFMERELSSRDNGEDEGGSGNGTPKPEPECEGKVMTTISPDVCDEEALATKCAGVCEKATCRDYPTATCRPKDCEDCTPVWSVNGKEVNCNDRPCPGLWTHKGSHCYRVQNRYGFNFKGAQKYCLRQGGHLVSINSYTEQKYVTSMFQLDGGPGYWTSGKEDPESKKWVWQQPDADHPVSWTYWNSREPNNDGYEGFREDRIALKQSGRRWGWNDATSLMKLYPICEAAPEKIQSLCESKPCMNGGSCTTVSQDMYKCECGKHYSGKYCELYNDNSAWNQHEGHLYLVVSDYSFNWQDALTYCAMHNAYLVSINTKQESDFIKGLLDKKGVSDPTYSFYTGGYKAYVGGSQTLQWADGTVISFKDWGRREPSSSSEKYVLLKFYTENNKWAWNDHDGKPPHGFICEKQVSRDARRNLGDSYSTGKLQRLYVKKWTQPDPTMEY